MKFMKGHPNRTGIYAATIRYHNGVFYIISTNVAYGENAVEHHGNFIIHTTNPYGEWSDPIWLDCPGIDPSLFFDQDGKVYYCGANGGIYLYEIDILTGAKKQEEKIIWNGSGGSYPEGPHIYARKGWYYLMISEGGTEYCHMITVARSKNIEGPYESYENNPILSNRSLPTQIKATGHGDIVEDQNGNWWAVCLGIRPLNYPNRHNLGRETMLLPMYWNNQDWPVMGNNGVVEVEVETELLPLNQNHEILEHNKNCDYIDYFEIPDLDMRWNFIYEKLPNVFLIRDEIKGLQVIGNKTSLSEADSIAWIGHRQQHHSCQIRTKLSFPASKDLEEAGLTIYMNNRHHYEVALTQYDGVRYLIFRRQIGSLWKVENKIEYKPELVYLQIEATKENYTFYYSENGTEYHYIGQGEVDYLTTEVGGAFTGNYFGLYATGNGKECTNPATFHYFEYCIFE
ncbi:MAG: family 43 glycosylhydrolase, partial [Clostridiales bacterium]|nr:family 43 glycosylhydrolase [Clostridiales bacterium]